MGKSSIDYINYVWNPYTSNCTKVSAGCKFCYAEAFTDRLQGAGTFRGIPTLRQNADKLLKEIPAGQIVGVNFLSDTWHERVSLSVIQYVHERIQSRPDCIFVYTTKRSSRLALESHKVIMPYNLWVGVSVEDASQIGRITHLHHSFARHRWISFEPLLSAIQPTPDVFRGIEWIVTGAESGLNRRHFELNWATQLGTYAQSRAIPWYHKQGSHQYPGRNAEINGHVIQELPAAMLLLKATQKSEPEEIQPKLF